MLSSCPHRIIADLAVIYHVMFQVDSKDDIVSCLISDKHLKIWNIDENELFLKAMENTPTLALVSTNMIILLSRIRTLREAPH